MSCVRLIRSGSASSTVSAELEQLNRGGAIRFMGELTPGAYCGTSLVEIERRSSLCSPPILAISEVDCVTPCPAIHSVFPFNSHLLTLPPTTKPSQASEKLTARYKWRFINCADRRLGKMQMG
ncbi:uncharacterized protein LOC143183025 [Calliopsis andreniformis]|uniref:uncharacterized protein LOC143183025 n=1 Tax=Calliopsis andreniformis TaxID=337506 RepID=UPI003FCCFAC1